MTTLIPLRGDHAAILAKIHEECFEKPWEESFFTTLLKEQQTACPVFGWLYIKDKQQCGFILARNQITQTEILTFAVRPAFQKQGIGTILLIHLQQHDSSQPIFLEVAVDNQKAINLYQQHGFKIMGKRPNYYPHQRPAIDAYIMQKI